MICLPASIVFILMGFITMKLPAKKINYLYGYRTSLSMRNQDTWDVAQNRGGFTMMIIGVFNCIFGVWSVIQPIEINSEYAQMIFLILSAIAIMMMVESYLNKIFDKDGIRK